MGLLDFFKINKKHYDNAANIEDIFSLAENDTSYRPLFYRTILDADIYLLTFPAESQDLEPKKVKVRNWDDGVISMFTSIEKIFENNIINEEVTYVMMKGKAIFETLPNNTSFVLNPYSTPLKEFTPLEIQKLLNGELFKPDQERKVTNGENIIITPPKENSTAISQALRNYCTTRKEIRGAYLASMRDTYSDEATHLIIGLDVKGNLRQIFGELNEAIRPHIPKDEPIDMIDLNGSKNISNDLKKNRYKVY